MSDYDLVWACWVLTYDGCVAFYCTAVLCVIGGGADAFGVCEIAPAMPPRVVACTFQLLFRLFLRFLCCFLDSSSSSRSFSWRSRGWHRCGVLVCRGFCAMHFVFLCLRNKKNSLCTVVAQSDLLCPSCMLLAFLCAFRRSDKRFRRRPPPAQCRT